VLPHDDREFAHLIDWSDADGNDIQAIGIAKFVVIWPGPVEVKTIARRSKVQGWIVDVAKHDDYDTIGEYRSLPAALSSAFSLVIDQVLDNEVFGAGPEDFEPSGEEVREYMRANRGGRHGPR